MLVANVITGLQGLERQFLTLTAMTNQQHTPRSDMVLQGDRTQINPASLHPQTILSSNETALKRGGRYQTLPLCPPWPHP